MKLVSDTRTGREITLQFTESELATVLAALSVPYEEIEKYAPDGFDMADDCDMHSQFYDILYDIETEVDE